MDHNCIICMSDAGYTIVGPFTSENELVAYGRRWQEERGDDPRWQSIHLVDPAAAPKHVIPYKGGANEATATQ